jgi:flagellar hook-associated protein 3 FlgL
MANAQDPSGNHLFSGSRVGQPAFAPPEDDPTGSPVYQGDRTRMEVLIGDQRTLPTNRAGPEVFTRVVRTDGAGELEGVGFFQSLDDLVDAVANSSQDNMQRGNQEVDALIDGLVLAQADIGTDMSNLDQQTMTLEDLTNTIKMNLSSVEDLDYAKAITQMNKQMMSLEAAQSSFSKISQLSLFSYLR